MEIIPTKPIFLGHLSLYTPFGYNFFQPIKNLKNYQILLAINIKHFGFSEIKSVLNSIMILFLSFDTTFIPSIFFSIKNWFEYWLQKKFLNFNKFFSLKCTFIFISLTNLNTWNCEISPHYTLFWRHFFYIVHLNWIKCLSKQLTNFYCLFQSLKFIIHVCMWKGSPY